MSALDPQGEWIAQIVYETWAKLPGYVDWQRDGNSDMQEDARAVAKYIRREIEESHTQGWFWTGFIVGLFLVMTFAAIIVGWFL